MISIDQIKSDTVGETVLGHNLLQYRHLLEIVIIKCDYFYLYSLSPAY